MRGEVRKPSGLGLASNLSPRDCKAGHGDAGSGGAWGCIVESAVAAQAGRSQADLDVGGDDAEDADGQPATDNEGGEAPGEPDGEAPAGSAGRQERGVAWGPFTLAQIWSHGKLVGAGATCGRHADATGLTTTLCKKSVRFGRNELPEATCFLRLKRWLVAGMDDSSWGPEARKEHIKLGGPGLEHFAEGLDEASLDELAQMDL